MFWIEFKELKCFQKSYWTRKYDPKMLLLFHSYWMTPHFLKLTNILGVLAKRFMSNRLLSAQWLTSKLNQLQFLHLCWNFQRKSNNSSPATKSWPIGPSQVRSKLYISLLVAIGKLFVEITQFLHKLHNRWHTHTTAEIAVWVTWLWEIFSAFPKQNYFNFTP